MKLNSKLILGICIAILATTSAFAEYTPSRPEIVSSRLSGMGGANPALAGRGIDSLSINPAAFAFEERAMRAVGIEAVGSGSLYDAINILSIANNANNLEPQEAADQLADLIANYDGLYAATNITGPLSISYVANNFGLGIFNRTYAYFDAPTTDEASFSVGEEILLTGGYGFKVINTTLHELALGIQGKFFFQFEATQTDELLPLVEAINAFTIGDIESGIGVGFDLGVLYRFNLGEIGILPGFLGSLSAGVVCRDVYTAVFYNSYDSLDQDLQLGIAWQPVFPTDFLRAIISGLTISVGMSDLLLLSERNPVLNISVGAEVVLFNLLSIRAGLKDVCPAVGIGIDFEPLQLDLAFYGSELGNNPGEHTVYNLALGLGFGF